MPAYHICNLGWGEMNGAVNCLVAILKGFGVAARRQDDAGFCILTKVNRDIAQALPDV